MHAWCFLRMTQLLDSGVCLLIYLSCIGSYNTTYIFNYSGVCMLVCSCEYTLGVWVWTPSIE